METLEVLGSILVLLGILGSILPVMPGPFLSFVGIILLYFEKSGEVSWIALLIFGIAMVVLLVFDYAAPIIGARYFGASKKGVWGAIAGGFIGMMFFPPLGIFLGAVLGAFALEIYGGKETGEAFKSAGGVLAGSAAVLVLQVAYSVSAAVYFFVKLF